LTRAQMPSIVSFVTTAHTWSARTDISKMYAILYTINPYLKTYNPYCQILMDFFCTRSISIVTNLGGYMPGGHGITI
jgi:hypothetical protein